MTGKSINEYLMNRLARPCWDCLRYYVVGLISRLSEHHAFLMSGGLAFSIFICAVPMLLVVFAALGSVLEQPTVVAEINTFIEGLMPYPEYAASLKAFVGERLQRTADLKQVAGIIGVVGLLFAASGLFSSLRTILNTVFKARNTESVVIGKLWDIGLVLLVLIMFVVLMLVLPILEAVTSLAGNVTWLGETGLSLAQKATVLGLSLVALVGAFSAIYWLVPWRKPNRRTTMVAALSAAILWLLAKELFGYYIGHMVTLKHIYGVYAFLIVAAFWIYYSALVLIAAAEIGQLHSERRRPKQKPA